MYQLTTLQAALVIAVGLIAFYIAMRTAKFIFKIFFWGIALLVAAWAVMRLIRP
jgi:hypothetical protein